MTGRVGTAGRRVHLALAAAVAALLLLLSGALLSVRTSEAAWVDPVVVSASVAAGTWGGGGDGPFSPGNDDTVISDVNWSVPSAAQACADIDITTDSTTPIAWAVDVDTSQPPYNGGLPDDLRGATVDILPAPGGVGRIVGTGSGADDPFNAQWNNLEIMAGQTATATICAYNLPLPEIVDPGPDTYTYTTELTGTSQYNACAVTTVTGHASPFYVGVEVVVDWSDVVDQAVADGQISQAEGDVLASLPLTRWESAGAVDVGQDGDIYTVRGTTGQNSAIVDGKVGTVSGCVS